MMRKISFLLIIFVVFLTLSCDAAKDVIDYAAQRAAETETTSEEIEDTQQSTTTDQEEQAPLVVSPEAQAEWDRLCDPSRYAEQVSSQVHMAKYCAEQNNKDIWVAKVWSALQASKEKEAERVAAEAEAERVAAEAKRVAAEAEARRVAAEAEAKRAAAEAEAKRAAAEAQKKVLASLYGKYRDASIKIQELRDLLAQKKARGIGYVIVPSKPGDTYHLRLRKATRHYEARLWSEKEKIKRDIVTATKNADVALENYCKVDGALSALCG